MQANVADFVANEVAADPARSEHREGDPRDREDNDAFSSHCDY